MGKRTLVFRWGNHSQKKPAKKWCGCLETDMAAKLKLAPIPIPQDASLASYSLLKWSQQVSWKLHDSGLSAGMLSPIRSCLSQSTSILSWEATPEEPSIWSAREPCLQIQGSSSSMNERSCTGQSSPIRLLFGFLILTFMLPQKFKTDYWASIAMLGSLSDHDFGYLAL